MRMRLFCARKTNLKIILILSAVSILLLYFNNESEPTTMTVKKIGSVWHNLTFALEEHSIGKKAETPMDVSKLVSKWLQSPIYQGRFERAHYDIENMAIVTFSSAKRLRETLESCLSLKLQSELLIVPYYVFVADDVDYSTIKRFRKMCKKAIVNRFSRVFAEFPRYAHELESHRFKVLITALALHEYPIVMWADPSIRFRAPTSTVYTNLIKRKLKKSTIDLQLYRPSKYSIFELTPPKMYSYFSNIDTVALKRVAARKALLVLYFGTNNGWNLFSKLFSCAMDPRCMNPTDLCFAPNASIVEASGCYKLEEVALNLICYSAAKGRPNLYTMRTNAVSVADRPRLQG